MSNLKYYRDELQQLETANQVIGYWERKQDKLLRALKSGAVDPESAGKIIHVLAKSLNEREKYASVYYLHNQAYLPLKDELVNHELLGELKFELGRGLHHNGRFSLAKTYFNELAAAGFDTSRIDNWWDQSAVSSVTNKKWIKVFLLPTFGRFFILFLSSLIAYQTQHLVLSITLYALLHESYEFWWQQYATDAYLKEFEDNPAALKVKQSFIRKQYIEVAAAFIIFIISFFLEGQYYIPALITAAGVLNSNSIYRYLYLSREVGKLNREQALKM